MLISQLPYKSNNGNRFFPVIHANLSLCAEGFNPSSIDYPTLYAPHPYICEPPTFDNIWLTISPNEMRDKRKNKLTRERCFFMFSRVRNNVSYFVISNTFTSNTRPRFDYPPPPFLQENLEYPFYHFQPLSSRL